MQNLGPRLPAHPRGRGQMVVTAMLLVGISAAGFAWWWNRERGRRALEFYGAEAAMLIRTAPRVEYLRSPPNDNIDISQAAGLLNARTSLLSDASYEWEQPPPPEMESPLLTVRFSADERAVNVTFDFENRIVTTSSTGKSVVVNTRTAEGWRAYLARQTKTLN